MIRICRSPRPVPRTDGAPLPFKRRIVDQQGIVRNDGSKGLEPMELMHMDWLCENVIGGFPKYEDILPDARAMVDLIGVPPSREEVGSL